VVCLAIKYFECFLSLPVCLCPLSPNQKLFYLPCFLLSTCPCSCSFLYLGLSTTQSVVECFLCFLILHVIHCVYYFGVVNKLSNFWAQLSHFCLRETFSMFQKVFIVFTI